MCPRTESQRQKRLEQRICAINFMIDLGEKGIGDEERAPHETRSENGERESGNETAH